MEDSLKRHIEASLAQHSGTDSEHIFGVAAATERRRKAVTRLLEEAKNIIAEEGMAALTFRKLSSRCEMAVSNLQYYFPSSEDMIRALMRYIVSGYLETLLNGSFLEIDDPEKRLVMFISIQVEDIKTKTTNSIFMALWDLAQRDTFVSKWMGEIYSVERSILMSILEEIHPEKSKEDILHRSAIISSLIEGLMPLFGPAAPLVPDLGNVHDAAIRFACLVAGIEPPTSTDGS